MVKRMLVRGIGLLVSVLAIGLYGAQGQEKTLKVAEWELNLRVLEGLREGAAEPAKVVTASYLKYLLSANFKSEGELADQEKQIKRTFNLKDVKLLTETNLAKIEGQPEGIAYVFRLDGKEYLVQVRGGSQAVRPSSKSSHRFSIAVFEQSGPEKVNLLDTEFGFPTMKNFVVFGFEDTQGKPYFIALRETKMSAEGGVGGGVLGGVEGGVELGVEGGVMGEVEGGVVQGGVEGGVMGGVEGGVVGGVPGGATTQELAEFEKGAIRCVGDIKPPKLLKLVQPVYPAIARQAHIGGVVILEAKIDESGRVMDAKILRSVPLLDQAAIDAVKQWVYEPLILEGKPQKALFTTTVAFKLSEKDIEEFATGAVKITGDLKPPKLLKLVQPVYPEIAHQAHVEGVVILQAKTDIHGRVQDVMVLRSVPLLDQAAIDAVKQWVYEPMVINGEPKEAVFTTTVRFELKDEDKKAAAEKAGTKGEEEKGAVRATGEINPPRLIKRVDPVYPEEARKAGIQGIVILEAMTDAKGNIVRVKVLNSIPELDQAAVDALKQWKYEPMIIDGKPTGVVFTVTVRFALH
jgi:TonB family protein